MKIIASLDCFLQKNLNLKKVSMAVDLTLFRKFGDDKLIFILTSHVTQERI